jgi:hypothetical protein
VSLQNAKPPSRRTRRVPANTILFDWIIPALFVLFGLLTIAIVLFSVGVMTGLVRYQ